MTPLIRFSLRFRGAIIALFVLLTGYGLVALTRARLDVFPEFAPPLVVLQTDSPGLSPRQVELLVTQPLENALDGLLGLETMVSKSTQGLSMITLTFREGTDIYRNRQLVSERLSEASRTLPSGVRPPILLPLTSSTANVLTIGLTSRRRSLMDLRTYADWTLKPQLLGIPGVAGVGVIGGDIRQVQIQVRPGALVRFGLSLSDVAHIVALATGVRGAGVVDTRNQRLVLTFEGQPMTPESLSQVVLVRKNGANVRLGDVARVTDASEPPVGKASIMGSSGVILMIKEQYGADMMAVTQDLDRSLRSLAPALKGEGIVLHLNLFRPADFVNASMDHLRFAILAGAVLVVAVLLLFLLNLRAALISATAIPVSLLGGIAVLQHFGVGLNTMTLGGLAIALGEVVDDAIVDVENILRRLRENRLLDNPSSPPRVILRASIEIRSPTVFATLMVILAFLPVLTLSGVTGKLFAPLGLAYVASIAASLVVAMTLTPALSYLLLGHRPISSEDPPFLKRLKARYPVAMAPIERRAGASVVAVVALSAFVLGTVPFFGGDLIPNLKEGHFIIHMRTLPGTSLEESLRLGRRVTRVVAGIEGVRSVSQRAGRSTLVGDLVGTYSSEFDVDLSPSARQGRILREIYRRLDPFVGASFRINTFLTERIHETVSTFGAPVVINVYGNNLDMLDRKAQEIAAVLRTVPGARGVQIQAPPGEPRLAIRLRENDLARWGIDPVSVMDDIQTAYQGRTVSQIYEGNRLFDVSVVLDPVVRQDPTAVRSLLLRNGEGMLVPLSQVADITESSGRFVILHKGARRLQTVTSLVSGQDLTSFVVEAERRIRSQVHFPPGTYMVFAGDIREQSKASRELLERSLLAAGGMILLLFLALRSARAVFLVLLNLPFALAGGAAVVLATGGVLSVGSLVGFVTLSGITLRNAIMLISHYRFLVREEGALWGPETAIRGARERLVPILMTACVTAVGMVPLALTSGAPGNEIEGPMATVVLGGLVSSTALNLLVMPTLALRFARFDQSTTEAEFD
ncbi:MAG: efflux RND transporter permease subunit [Nitrospirae bacterium]|jgi:CzcA family heavy metal efflux pump|nr:efflux RND transporter permease subunit [Nitrospirota bacterium]